MGFGDDWRAALEQVKQAYVPPGEQPELIRRLAREAVAFITERDLVTVPPLADEIWRMEMMSPRQQLVSPFFLGGEVIQVAYPTDSMAHDDKLMSMRGQQPALLEGDRAPRADPGHHLQGFMTSRYNTHRGAFSTPFWGEGWALYWEMLLWDLGFAKTPQDRMGMLFWRSHRLARIIFSLRVHLGTMTPQEAIDLLVDRVGHERANAEAEVRRSFNGSYSPLYQAAYMLGGLQIRALHEELVESGRMTNRQFHDAILQGGRMPIEMVRARLLGTCRSRATIARTGSSSADCCGRCAHRRRSSDHGALKHDLSLPYPPNARLACRGVIGHRAHRRAAVGAGTRAHRHARDHQQDAVHRHASWMSRPGRRWPRCPPATDRTRSCSRATARTAVVTDYGTGPAPGSTLTVIDVPARTRWRARSPWHPTSVRTASCSCRAIRWWPSPSEASRAVILVHVGEGHDRCGRPPPRRTDRTWWASRPTACRRGRGTSAATPSPNSTCPPARRSGSIDVPEQPEAINVTSDGSEVWVGSNATGKVSVVDAYTGAVTTAAEGFQWPYRVLFSPDLSLAFIPDYRGESLRVLERKSRKELARMAFPGGGPQGISITPDGKHLFLSMSRRGEVAIIDVATRRVLVHVAAGETPDGVVYTPFVAAK